MMIKILSNHGLLLMATWLPVDLKDLYFLACFFSQCFSSNNTHSSKPLALDTFISTINPLLSLLIFLLLHH